MFIQTSRAYKAVKGHATFIVRGGSRALSEGRLRARMLSVSVCVGRVQWAWPRFRAKHGSPEQFVMKKVVFNGHLA